MDEITAILVDLFIIFAGAQVAGELVTRFRQPVIVSEVLVVRLDRHREQRADLPCLVAEP